VFGYQNYFRIVLRRVIQITEHLCHNFLVQIWSVFVY